MPFFTNLSRPAGTGIPDSQKQDWIPPEPAPPGPPALLLVYKFPNGGGFLTNTGTKAGFNLAQADICGG